MDKFDDKLFFVVEAVYGAAVCDPVDCGKFSVGPFVFVLSIMLNGVRACSLQSALLYLVVVVPDERWRDTTVPAIMDTVVGLLFGRGHSFRLSDWHLH